MLSMAIFPLWWSAFSEAFGRRSIYLISFILFVLFGILSAVSNSIATLVVMRMLSGGAAASVQAVGAGTIADVWEPRERGRAMGIFYLGPLCGPLFAPIIGGALAQRWNWRATLWFLVIYGGELAQTAFRDRYGWSCRIESYCLVILRPLMGTFRHNMAVHCLCSPGNLEGKDDLEREGCCWGCSWHYHRRKRIPNIEPHVDEGTSAEENEKVYKNGANGVPWSIENRALAALPGCCTNSLLRRSHLWLTIRPECQHTGYFRTGAIQLLHLGPRAALYSQLAGICPS